MPAVRPVASAIASRVQLQSVTRVSSTHDPAEKEAESTAKRILRMPAPEAGVAEPGLRRKADTIHRTPGSPSIARFAHSVQLMRERVAAPLIARQAEAPATVAPEVSAQISGSQAGGTPLPPSVRQFMEPRFGADFSHVRIHTGEGAATLSRQLGAQAFTVGGHVYFGQDRFRPESSEGRELIAHELTHTIQQGAAIQQSTAARRSEDLPIVEQASPKDAAAAASDGGKRMFRTSDGKMVELPPDLTAEEAARLESEAKAAEKRLGKGPPPKPVPDVKKLSKKEKPEKPRPGAKGRRGAAGKGRAAPKAGPAAAVLLKAVGPSKVAQYLAARGAPALSKGIGMVQRLSQNEQTHDNAAEKLSQSEKAVVVPDSEGQSKSNTAQVGTVSGRPAPTADENKGKRKLQETLQENVPRTIEDVDNFKRDRKAQHMGADVMKVVQSDKDAVVSTFGEMENTPPPAPPEQIPEELPPEEAAPPTPAMNLGQGAVAPLLNEHTDLSNYTKEADGKLKEEGITQEQLDMVDSGELAEANREKKGMEKSAKTEPLAVQAFARQEAVKVDRDLKQDENKERSALRVKRKTGLSATAKKQKGTKSALEKKRQEVADKINGIYKAAQDSVKKKLADLETRSMKRFDDGNARATKEFEDNVKSDLDAFKSDRYSGWFGWARRAKDWLLGMDDLPQVKAIFERHRSAFVDTISKLVEQITADNKRVIQECKDELNNAKKAIKEYVDKLGPDLKQIGKQAAGEMNEKLNELDQFIGQKEEELQSKLKDKQTAAIRAIDEKIEKMKEAMSGALAKLGKLLLLAAKKFFTWALEKFGFSLSTIENIINKGLAVLKAIFTQPIQFVKNLISAAKTGFLNFGKNFLTHLKNAVFEWLTGSLEGITLPESWNLKGILSVVFQLLGITYQNIRSHLVKLIPEPVVKALETTFSLVKTLITEGPMAAWEQLKDIAGELKDAFVEAVKDWIKWKVVEEAIKTVLAIFIPGAGIIRAIVAIYDTIVFFIQKAKQILQMIGNFLGSIAEIAAGNIAAAAAALEEGLARGLKLVIAFLAKLLRLDGITKRIRAAIQSVRAKVDNVIAKAAAWIVAQARRLGRFVAQAGVPQDPNERLRLAARDAVAAARRLTGTVTRALLNPVLQAVKLRYGLTDIQPYEQAGNWWVKVTINPTLSQDLGLLINREDASQVKGVLDLYRGIYLLDKVPNYHLLTGQQLADQLTREEDFAEAVYTILRIDRLQAPSVTPEQRRKAAEQVVAEVRKTEKVRNVYPWWNATKRPNLFLTLLQRFVNMRTEFQEELKSRARPELKRFTFTDLPFISTTKSPSRAAKYAFASVKATNLPADVEAALRSPSGKVIGKVFVYLFRGSDLVSLRAADIRYLAGKDRLKPDFRFSTADKEVAFTGSIPTEHRVGTVIATDSDKEKDVADKAKAVANSHAAAKGGLIPWSEN
jgi:hypothetical protein